MNEHIQALANRLRRNAENPADARDTNAVLESARLATEFDNGDFGDDLARNYAAFCEDDRTAHHTMNVERELVAGIGNTRDFRNADELLSAITERARGPIDDGVTIDNF